MATATTERIPTTHITSYVASTFIADVQDRYVDLDEGHFDTEDHPMQRESNQQTRDRLARYLRHHRANGFPVTRIRKPL